MLCDWTIRMCFISPSDSSDGICCVLSAPCLALSNPTPSSIQGAPPVVMRRNLDWKKVKKYISVFINHTNHLFHLWMTAVWICLCVNRSQLLNPNELDSVDSRDNMMSYGVRSSIAAYLSLTSVSEPEEAKGRKKKSKSMYVMSDHSNMDLDEN